jgi:uncharacterized protein (DUF488 family)
MTRQAKKSRRISKKNASKRENLRIFTIGHSNRPIEEFLRLLDAHGVKRVADIRTIPRSRHSPQFNAETLAESLRGAGRSLRRESTRS